MINVVSDKIKIKNDWKWTSGKAEEEEKIDD